MSLELFGSVYVAPAHLDRPRSGPAFCPGEWCAAELGELRHAEPAECGELCRCQRREEVDSGFGSWCLRPLRVPRMGGMTHIVRHCTTFVPPPLKPDSNSSLAQFPGLVIYVRLCPKMVFWHLIQEFFGAVYMISFT